MKYIKKVEISILFLGALVSSCASYQAMELSALDPVCVTKVEEAEGLSVGCKEFTERDCDKYLDRDVRSKGYHAIQLTFQNSSDKSYRFSTAGVSLPCSNADEVAETVHTSTAGRVLAYSAGGLLFAPLFIPAIVDGIGSSNANMKLDHDFAKKAKGDFTIEPYSFNKTIVFIPHEDFESKFDLTLIEQPTGVQKRIKLRATR